MVTEKEAEKIARNIRKFLGRVYVTDKATRKYIINAAKLCASNDSYSLHSTGRLGVLPRVPTIQGNNARCLDADRGTKKRPSGRTIRHWFDAERT